MQIKELTYLSDDGLHSIYAKIYLPECRPRAIIQVLHGVAEYIGRYDSFAEKMTSLGYIVCGNNHLGHGQSCPPEKRGYFADENGWLHVCNDAVTLGSYMKKTYPATDYFIFGHSMGSFLARTIFLKNLIETNGVILSGTSHQNMPITFCGRLLAKREKAKTTDKYQPNALLNKLAFGGYNKKYNPARTDKDWISSLPDEVDRYLADDLCGFDISCGLFLDMLDGFDMIRNPQALSEEQKATPVFIISGKDDPVGGYGKGVGKVYVNLKKAGVGDVTQKLYEGRHELLNERVAGTVICDIDEWIKNRIKTQNQDEEVNDATQTEANCGESREVLYE